MLLLDTVDDWRRERDAKKTVGVIFLDLRKAFDHSVSHGLLLNKLPSFGLSQSSDSIHWFKNYLDDRQQFVQYRNYNTSTNECLTLGVPHAGFCPPCGVLPPLKDRRRMKLAGIVHKCLNNCAPISICSKLQSLRPTHDYQTRASQSSILIRPKFSSNYGRLSFLGVAPDIWNKLPGT